MRVLTISSAAQGCMAAVVEKSAVRARARLEGAHGLAGAMPPAIAALLAKAGLPELVAVVVGPGGFTGLRAGIALALGVGLGASVPVVGVATAEALADSLPFLGGRALWVAMTARPGRVFIARDGLLGAFDVGALPEAPRRVAVAGDAANGVAASLAARGLDVMLTSARLPQPLQIAAVGLRRLRGEVASLSVVPLYVDLPEARVPALGLRPAPK